jgi:hypothetical protein
MLNWCKTHVFGNVIGGFKTSHSGFLTLNRLPQTGLGTSAHESVIVKQAYERVQNAKGKSGSKVHRLPDNEQYDAIRGEAESIYWAKAIWDKTSSRIQQKWPAGTVTVGVGSFQADGILEEIKIPELRWVECGIAFVNPGTLDRQTVLIEEKITGQFVKYVHNMESKPLNQIGKPGSQRRTTAEFLVFTQHLQWEYSRQTAFISDYQGDY